MRGIGFFADVCCSSITPFSALAADLDPSLLVPSDGVTSSLSLAALAVLASTAPSLAALSSTLPPSLGPSASLGLRFSTSPAFELHKSPEKTHPFGVLDGSVSAAAPVAFSSAFPALPMVAGATAAAFATPFVPARSIQSTGSPVRQAAFPTLFTDDTGLDLLSSGAALPLPLSLAADVDLDLASSSALQLMATSPTSATASSVSSTKPISAALTPSPVLPTPVGVEHTLRSAGVDFVPRRAAIPSKTSGRHLKKSADVALGRPSSCVWVGNVDAMVPEDEFRLLLEQFGSVKSIRMLPKSKCAFVTFQDAACTYGSCCT
jgi:hypothetical protein